MLTVKVVRPDKSETIVEASDVECASPVQNDNRVSYFEFSPVKGFKRVDVFEGDVYVMNSSGKTVATYRLGTLQNAP